MVKSPPLSILITSLYPKNSITLQRMQIFSILNQAVVVGQATSQLPPLQKYLSHPTLITYFFVTPPIKLK
jgi:hypothetical protein